MMKLRNQKRSGRDDTTSPFLPQNQTNGGRPRLKFDSPEKTEEWLASRDKTDYTYSRSSSYIVTGVDSSYQVPIMSRLSQGAILRDTSSPMRQAQFQREVSASPNRRSDRLAKKTTINESSFSSRAHKSRSIQVSRHSISQNASLSHYHGNLAAAASDESVQGSSSSSTIASSASRMMSSLHHSSRTRSGLHQQGYHSDARDHSISHIYGLDANDGSELSDTESSSAVTSRVSGSNKETSEGWTSVDHTRQSLVDHTRRSSFSSSSSILSLLLLPVSAIITIVTSVMYFITTVIQTLSSSIARFFYGSSAVQSASNSQVSVNSMSSSLGNACSSVVRMVSVFIYRVQTSLLCVDVWWLVIIKRVTFGVIGSMVSLIALWLGRHPDRSTSAMTAAMLREKRRKQTSCCFCLLLLLGALALSYLMLAPFLLAVMSRNETKTESPLIDVNQQLGVLLGKLPSDGDDGGAAAAAAGSGCLQCLKQDDLMTLIEVMVKGQLGDLQSQLTSQNHQILILQQQRSQQESQITTLQERIGALIAQQGKPNDHTMLYINSMDGQLTRVRGELRNLQLSRLRGYGDVQIEKTEGSKIILDLSQDLQGLAKEVSKLQTELDGFHAQQMMEISVLQGGSDKFRRDLQALHVNMVSWEERLSVNVTFLEAKLTGLFNDVQLLQSEDRQTNAKLAELVDRLNSFESGFTDVKTEMRNFRSEFGEMLAMRDQRGDEDKRESVDSRLEFLKIDVASLRLSQAGSSESLKDLQGQYQTLSASLSGVQSDVNVLRTSLEDLGSRQVGAVSSTIKQLNIKLAKLDTDLSLLQASFLTLQGSDTEKVDKSGLENLHVSISNAEQQLNVFVTDIDSLKVQVTELRKQLGDATTSQEEQRAQTGAALRQLKTDVGELSIRADRMVVLENMQGDADTNSLVQQLSEEVGAVRLDVGRMASLQGDSDLVVGFNDLRSSLTALESQINYFDMTQMQMKRTISGSMSDLKDEVSQMNEAFGDQSTAMTALNVTILSLKQGQDKLEAFATRQEMQDLQTEMTNLKAMIDRLAVAQSNYAMSGDIDILKTKVAGIKSQVDSTHLHLTEMSATYTGDSASHSALAADLVKLQGAVKHLEAMMYNDNQEPINLSLLDSRISSMTSILDDNDEKLAAFLAAGGFQGATGSKDAFVALQKDLASVRSDTDRLNGLLYSQTENGESVNAIVLLLDRVSALEASMVLMKTSPDGGGGGGSDVRMQQLRGEINNLKEEMMRQTALHHAGAGLGVLGAAMQDEINEARTNITRLQVDVHKCCKNKTGLLGWWMSPWFSKGKSSSGGSVNLSSDGNMDEERVKHIVLSALTMYSADKTGMVDYALESAGGSVISTRCSETHYSKTALLSIFGIPLWYMANSPRTVIQPDVQPGNCWAFKGTQGYMVIQLAGIIKPSAFSMEHIPKSLSPTGTIDSAPKEFSVWGLQDDDDSEGVLLGEYVYDQEGPPLQFFAIEKADVEPIPAVELKIHSNHGNLEYTCLYRFRVHGTLHRR